MSDGTTRSIIGNGKSRVMCIDVKDETMAMGHLDGSIR